MLLRYFLLCALVVAACGGQPRSEPPTPAPPGDPAAALAVPEGPVLFEPEQLIYPPEDFPLASDVGRDTAIGTRAWEREFVPRTSIDFRWFVVRLYVLEPDVPSAKFVAENDCDTITWDAERPLVERIGAPAAADGSRACAYRFGDGQRVLYYMTGYRNVGVVVGTQPRRAEVSDTLAVEWISSLARRQIAIIGGVLARTAR
ncbi:MAG: hypothetical protein FJ028_01810 [Chloroflexi bacterium]|nr:hypothetical protein [Chloroflexota bacterium]